MKNIITVICLVSASFAFGQNPFQATAAKQVNDTVSKMQCSMTGIGLGKTKNEAQQIADSNLDKALLVARRRGRYAFSNKSGSGACNCVKFNQ